MQLKNFYASFKMRSQRLYVDYQNIALSKSKKFCFELSPKCSVAGFHIRFVNSLLEKKQGFVGKLSQDKEDHLTSNDVYVVISRHLGF